MSELRLNSYHIMWLFVMFDLPTVTKKDKHISALFRKNLEKDGFTMHQYSVYIRFCGSLESAYVHIKRIKSLTKTIQFEHYPNNLSSTSSILYFPSTNLNSTKVSSKVSLFCLKSVVNNNLI